MILRILIIFLIYIFYLQVFMFDDQINWFKNILERTYDKKQINFGLMKLSLLYSFPNYEGRVFLVFFFLSSVQKCK